MSEEKSIDQHYQKSAAEYEGAWFYRNDSPYQDFLVEQHLECLDLQPRDKTIADVGAGSCNFSAKLGKAAGVPVACIEPSATLLEPQISREGCTKVLASGEDYFKGKPEGVTKVIVKETIHHMPLDKGSTATVFEDMVATLRQNGGGRLVVMTRPHDCSHFPFFTRVSEEWKKGQPKHEIYVKALRESGFDLVDTRTRDFEVRMKMEEWRQMVRNRFWSCFRSLSDAELEEGLAELGEKRKEEDLVFPDRLLFIVATVKPEDPKLDPAPEGSVEMKVSTKKPPGAYVRGVQSFLKGVEAKPAEEEKDGKKAREAQEAKPPVEHLRISGLGEAVNVAVTAATQAEEDGCCTITRIQTAYPSMEGSGRGCGQIVIDVKRT